MLFDHPSQILCPASVVVVTLSGLRHIHSRHRHDRPPSREKPLPTVDVWTQRCCATAVYLGDRGGERTPVLPTPKVRLFRFAPSNGSILDLSALGVSFPPHSLVIPRGGRRIGCSNTVLTRFWADETEAGIQGIRATPLLDLEYKKLERSDEVRRCHSHLHNHNHISPQIGHRHAQERPAPSPPLLTWPHGQPNTTLACRRTSHPSPSTPASPPSAHTAHRPLESAPGTS